MTLRLLRQSWNLYAMVLSTWFCLVPVIHQGSLPRIFWAALTVFSVVGLTFRCLLRLSFFLFVVSLGIFLGLAQDVWLFSPAVMGILYASASIGALASLRERETVDSDADVGGGFPLHLRGQMLAFLGLWGGGLGLSALIPSPQTLWVLVFWSALMLFLGRSLWALCVHYEWFGYKMRRSIFVPSSTWGWRKLGLIVWGCLLATSFALLFWIF